MPISREHYLNIVRACYRFWNSSFYIRGKLNLLGFWEYQDLAIDYCIIKLERERASLKKYFKYLLIRVYRMDRVKHRIKEGCCYDEKLDFCNNHNGYKTPYGKKACRHHRSKPIKCIETNQTYDSVAEAARILGCSYRAIYHCLKGDTETSQGLHWQYLV